MKKRILIAQCSLLTFFFLTILSSSNFAQPKAECSGSMPAELIFDRTTKEYSPNPLTVRSVIKNSGDAALQNANVTIIYYNCDFDLVSPLLLMQQYSPSTILPGDSGVVQWQLSAKKKRGRWDTVQVCIISSYDNHPTNTCCWKTIIPPTEPIIHCTKHIVPKININSTKDGYDPMPFTIFSDYINDGGIISDSLFASIFLYPKLQLDSSEHNQAIKPLQPAILKPGEHATVSWTLWHPIVLEQYEYGVTWCVREKNFDSSCCDVNIKIPSLAKPSLSCATKGPDSLVYDPDIDNYKPNPFQVTVGVVNKGTLDVDSVRATIILPPDFVLDPPSQPLTKFFNPMMIGKWRNGTPPNELTWIVSATKKPKNAKTYFIQFRIDGVSDHQPIDPVYCDKELLLPGVRSQLDCRWFGPDSLSLNSDRAGVVPNPIILHWVGTNFGNIDDGFREVLLSIPNGNDGLNILTENPTVLNQKLKPGDSITVDFQVQVVNRNYDRSPYFTFDTITEDGDAMSCCHKNIFIPKVGPIASLSSKVNDNEYELLSQNYPNPFSTSTTISFNLSPTLSLNKERETIGQHRANLKVFDVFGREVLDLSKNVIGKSSLVISNSQLKNPGVYFYRLTVGNQSQTKMMMLLK